MNTIQTLNQLLAVHHNSLPRYLASAPPHRMAGEERAWEVLHHLIDDQKLMVDKIADLVEQLDGTPNRGEFPMEFTSMHDLSMDYLMSQSIDRQRREIGIIDELSNRLESGSQAKAVALEALGAAKAHLQSLEECTSSQAD